MFPGLLLRRQCSPTHRSALGYSSGFPEDGLLKSLFYLASTNKLILSSTEEQGIKLFYFGMQKTYPKSSMKPLYFLVRISVVSKGFSTGSVLHLFVTLKQEYRIYDTIKTKHHTYKPNRPC